MRFTLTHPDQPTTIAAYGFDRALSWWLEIRQAGRLVVEFDAVNGPVETTPRGVIDLLMAHGFFTEDDLQSARGWLGVAVVDEIDDPGARCAAEVVTNLKRAGDGDASWAT